MHEIALFGYSRQDFRSKVSQEQGRPVMSKAAREIVTTLPVRVTIELLVHSTDRSS